MINQWSVCPKCGGGIEYDDYEFDSCIWQPQTCIECGFEWQSVYQFTHNETRDAIPLNNNGEELRFYNQD